jgi:hypothetical protein
VNSAAEIDHGGWVAVRNEEVVWVRLEDLRFGPVEVGDGDLFSRFAEAYRGRAPENYRTAETKSGRDGGGERVVVLRLAQDDHWQEYRYSCTATTYVPIEMFKVFGPAEALGDLGRLAGAGVAGIAAGWLAWRVFRRRGT